MIAQIFAIAYVLLGLGMIINGAYYKKTFDSLLKNSGLMFFGGVMALVVGFLIIRVHNLWVKDWTVLITIIGWLALIKGAVLLLAPKALVDISRPMLKNTAFLGVFVLILGLIVGYFGFLA